MEQDRVSDVPVVTGEVQDVGPEQLLAGLSEQQITVLKLMAVGKTLTDAAKAANVSRMVIYRWIHADQNFMAALEQLRREIRRGIRVDIEALAEDALVNVQMAIAQGNDPRLCLMLLKYLGLLKPDSDSEAQL
jgi:IS30 family transposase